VPDLLAVFSGAGPVLVEVKVNKGQTLSFKPDYLARLQAYADLLGKPLLIAWKWHSLWTLFDARHLQLAKKNFNITHERAMRQNLLGLLAGDVAFTLRPGSGIHLDIAKEELMGTEHGDGGDFTETWKMRIAGVYFTGGNGERLSGLHGETQQLFATWDLQPEEEHSPDKILQSFVVREGQVQFAHVALVHLLSWESRSNPLAWRHLLQAPRITRTIDDFGRALDRGLKEGVVQYILHQRPETTPDFWRPKDDAADGAKQ
jgi:Holliday junction resolvase